MEEHKDHTICRRCGRKLKSPEARERGFGPVCWQKIQASNIKPLFIGGENKK